MNNRPSLVITSIAAPNAILRTIAEQCDTRKLHLYLIGDESSPPDFHIAGCDFYSIPRQLETGFGYAALCPLRHYARKNIGYLLAIRDGAQLIVETDDDNIPLPSFWDARSLRHKSPLLTGGGWVNVYRYFTDAYIWPRGLPLDAVQHHPPPLDQLDTGDVASPIQQGLADENPDVDAIYRLILPLPVRFAPGRRIALGNGSWCPFNSQNTAWWPEAYPLLYLPAYCSFRMTDIWRSLIAQRIAWENGWTILFESPTVYQQRNAHSLLRDFADEVPGFLHNRNLAEKLQTLSLRTGPENMANNLHSCYELFIQAGVVDPRESQLLDGWLADLASIDTANYPQMLWEPS